MITLVLLALIGIFALVWMVGEPISFFLGGHSVVGFLAAVVIVLKVLSWMCAAIG